MSKPKRKAFQRLDRRIKAWQETCKSVGAAKVVGYASKVGGYRKPGSMKK